MLRMLEVLPYGKMRRGVMAAGMHVKTFTVDGLATVVLPFAVLDDDLRVYFSTNSEERRLSAGPDYVIEAASAGGRQVRLLKPLTGFLTLAGVPDPCVKLQKFGVEMLPTLNGWADRVAMRLAFLEHLLGLADLRPIGAPDPVVEAAAQEALYSHALRLPVAVSEIAVPADSCSVLGWMHGKPAWISPESVAARVYAARQEPANEITLCDVVMKRATFAKFFEDVCYDLPVMDATACGADAVAFVTDENGCGRLVRYSQDDAQILHTTWRDSLLNRGQAVVDACRSWKNDMITGSIYEMAELKADYLAGGAAGINEANPLRFDAATLSRMRSAVGEVTKGGERSYGGAAAQPQQS